MDAALAAAARGLSRGDPLEALEHVALRTDPLALALRATALAQLGEYAAAKRWYRKASHDFGPGQAVARARCTVGLADVALASRELTFSLGALENALEVLTRQGDVANARYGQLLLARLALARGEVASASSQLQRVELRGASPALFALAALTSAELALRSIEPTQASVALTLASRAARLAGIPALGAEISIARQALRKPVARLLSAGSARLLTLDQVARVLASDSLVVDGCRRVVRSPGRVVDLATRPVLFNVTRVLAEVAPLEVSREELIRAGFGITRASESLRVRLRMSMTRLRRLLLGVAEVRATARGFALSPLAPRVQVLLPPIDDEASGLLAMIADGEAWSSSALAVALGASQRSVQRALTGLSADHKVTSFGRGKSRRWLAAPLTQFATPLLLPVASPRP